MVTTAMKLKDACSLGKKSYDQPRQHIKKQRHYFANKDLNSQGYGLAKVKCQIIDAFNCGAREDS